MLCFRLWMQLALHDGRENGVRRVNARDERRARSGFQRMRGRAARMPMGVTVCCCAANDGAETDANLDAINDRASKVCAEVGKAFERISGSAGDKDGRSRDDEKVRDEAGFRGMKEAERSREHSGGGDEGEGEDRAGVRYDGGDDDVRLFRIRAAERRMDVAVALERFGSAARARDEVRHLTSRLPLAQLRDEFLAALDAQDFARVALLRDRLAAYLAHKSDSAHTEPARNAIIALHARAKLLTVHRAKGDPSVDALRGGVEQSSASENATETAAAAAAAQTVEESVAAFEVLEDARQEAVGRGALLLPPVVSACGELVATCVVDSESLTARLVVRTAADGAIYAQHELPRVPFYMMFAPRGARLSMLSSSEHRTISLDILDLAPTTSPTSTSASAVAAAPAPLQHITSGAPLYYAFSADARHVLTHVGAVVSGGRQMIGGTVAVYDVAGDDWPARRRRRSAAALRMALLCGKSGGSFRAPQWVELGEGRRGALYVERKARGAALAAGGNEDESEKEDEDEDEDGMKEDVLMVTEVGAEGEACESVELCACAGALSTFEVSPDGELLALLVTKIDGRQEFIVDRNMMREARRALLGESGIAAESEATVVLSSDFSSVLGFKWSPNSRLLMYLVSADVDEGRICRWHTFDIETARVTKYDRFVPSPTFTVTVLPFFDQHCRAPAGPWSADSRAFLYLGSLPSQPRQPCVWVQRVPLAQRRSNIMPDRSSSAATPDASARVAGRGFHYHPPELIADGTELALWIHS
eukprot:CAMPEP_0185831228 /NCGR_PEP_ID=MMETSP1353-20130828/1361_1 /TAXON_ID=1077150 /ORGANISM="Erythrolobus australicus, Strain CCMP3124" /LENGTH=763 /DNA_ID=CAMNT_0028529269 /DNA_START=111 /DNA_END=2402 /DNA_ORIENTATION=-